MDIESFRASVENDAPPAEAGLALQAMWQDAKGDWDAAHKLAQAQDDATGAWVHAYLHRVEGDLRNAGHWYKRAGRPECSAALGEEWNDIVSALLR